MRVSEDGRRSGTVVACLVAILVLAPACAARVKDPLAQHSVIDARDRRVRTLQVDLAAIFAAPAVAQGLVAVAVTSLDRHDTLFRHNASRLAMPASNMKVLTLAAAAERLGWEYTFTTTIQATGPVEDGVLKGDLVVRGTGDPTLNSRQVSPMPILDGWADTVRAAGIRRIAGRLVGDDDAFDEQALGQGWSWDYLQDGYAAPTGALQVYEDAVALTIAPGDTVGAATHACFSTPGSGWAILNAAVTGTPGSSSTLSVQRSRGSTVVRLTGSMPPTAQTITRTLAVDNPTIYFLGLLAAALERRGITIGGGTADIDDLPPGSVAASGQSIVEYRSPPLDQAARTMMTISQNLYAETLLRAIGRVDGRAASAADGRAAVLEVLNAWGLPAGSVVIADGSGLSRYNYATADVLTRVLQHMYDDPRHRQHWMDAFPAGGEPGTLQKRFVGTIAEGRVRAKTGSIANVRALSGYVRSAGGEQLAFSILINNITASSEAIFQVIDAAVLRLAAFSRQH
jgi:serine-type D-Ala-D-Ala carboxypeptidase/endopeptidase (penicillin-binding protein 4)